MKRFAICIFMISSFLLISACATNKAAEDTQTSSTASFNYKPSVNHSYLTEENIGQEIVVKGKIVKSGNSFTLLENPDSKSRVSFVLDFEDESLKEITYFVLNIVYLKFCLSYAPYIRNIDSSTISNICILGFVFELICFICLGIGGLRSLNKKD